MSRLTRKNSKRIQTYIILSFRIGYNIAIFARTDLYDLLLSKIPSEKIKFNKKIIRVEQDEKEVRITCSDGTSYNGDVLVGADGAYSSVRQELYKEMQEKNILPVVDTQEMDKGYICMVGTTTPLDPAEYPGVDDEVANINQIIGMNSNYCVRTKNLNWSIPSLLLVLWNVLRMHISDQCHSFCCFSVECILSSRKQDLLERDSSAFDCPSKRKQVQECRVERGLERPDD